MIVVPHIEVIMIIVFNYGEIENIMFLNQHTGIEKYLIFFSNFIIKVVRKSIFF